MALSERAKEIKKVPEGFICTLKGYRKLADFIRPEYFRDLKYMESYMDWTDQDISHMIKLENKLSRLQH